MCKINFSFTVYLKFKPNLALQITSAPVLFLFLECQPCRKNWILFQEKCYLIDLRDSPWLSWNESRKHCQNSNADLVVIDSLEEQVSYSVLKFQFLHCNFNL